MNAQIKKKIIILVIACLVGIIVFWFYPVSNKLLLKIRTHAYAYGYSLPKDLTSKDVSSMPPAQAVPILTYHGVINKDSKEMERDPDEVNTSREVFIKQMETLKREGYETISVKEYDLFREGKFILPPKPVIITFDDGRKDSFYTVDKIFEKLGFRGTLFVATIKANENDPFYLSWEELKHVRDTGRWEIEAHGRRSHDLVVIDEKGNTDKHYLISRIYFDGKGFETVEEYKKRVEEDYVNGIEDIKNNLNITPQYFAVPLNDYGGLEATSEDFEEAYEFNRELTSKYFKLAFIQAEDKNGIATTNFYNYKYSEPYSIKRFSVKDSSADDLLKSLEIFAPKELNMVFFEDTLKNDVNLFTNNIQVLYGDMVIEKGITLSSDFSTQIGRIVIGDEGWKNYSFYAKLHREIGQSLSVLIYYSNDDNFISLNWGGGLISLKERVNGKERVLASYYPWFGSREVDVLLRVKNGIISAYFNGIVLIHGVYTSLLRGAAGFEVWDSSGIAKSTIKSFEIKEFGKRVE